jgi:hypothetical protein
MYMSRMISICKATNGYVLECSVPLKPDAKKSEKMVSCCSSTCDKQYIAKDESEVADLVADIMPLLQKDFKTEDEFDAAFKAATQDAETGETKEE